VGGRVGGTPSTDQLSAQAERFVGEDILSAAAAATEHAYPSEPAPALQCAHNIVRGLSVFLLRIHCNPTLSQLNPGSREINQLSKPSKNLHSRCMSSRRDYFVSPSHNPTSLHGISRPKYISQLVPSLCNDQSHAHNTEAPAEVIKLVSVSQKPNSKTASNNYFTVLSTTARSTAQIICSVSETPPAPGKYMNQKAFKNYEYVHPPRFQPAYHIPEGFKKAEAADICTHTFEVMSTSCNYV
jgi:hypothetical protein